MNVSKNFKGLQKNLLSFNSLLLIGIVILVVVLVKYNNDKVIYKDTMTTLSPSSYNNNESLDNNDYASINEPQQKPSNAGKMGNEQVNTNPSELLPKNTNNEWSSMTPVTNDLKNINLLNAGANYGINTVGSSLRNPNLQIRSEPSIPKTNVGPWNNTTIESDPYRRNLERDGCD